MRAKLHWYSSIFMIGDVQPLRIINTVHSSLLDESQQLFVPCVKNSNAYDRRCVCWRRNFPLSSSRTPMFIADQKWSEMFAKSSINIFTSLIRTHIQRLHFISNQNILRSFETLTVKQSNSGSLHCLNFPMRRRDWSAGEFSWRSKQTRADPHDTFDFNQNVRPEPHSC